MCNASAQLCKNIVLAGVGSVSLVDGTAARSAPPGNFLVHTDAAADATCAPRTQQPAQQSG